MQQIGPLSVQQQLLINKRQITIVQHLAEGGFAHLYLVTCPKYSDFLVLKVSTVHDEEGYLSALKEIQIMKMVIGNECFVQIIDSMIQDHNQKKTIFVLMEYCSGQSVVSTMKKNPNLPFQFILSVAFDVGSALILLHSKGIAHMDLKAENILMNQNRFKLCDFGSCIQLDSKKSQSEWEDLIQRQTTANYRSPEMIDLYSQKPINEKSDVWAFGVLLYYLMTYQFPFSSTIGSVNSASDLSLLNGPKELTLLIEWIFSKDPLTRPNMQQVMQVISKLMNNPSPMADVKLRDPSSFTLTEHPPQVQSTPAKQGLSAFSLDPEIVMNSSAPAASGPVQAMRRGRPKKESDPFKM